MAKFKNKYRIESTRLRYWDYGWNGAYFVTICTKNRRCWFGDVVNAKMNLSAMGHIANSCWYEIPKHFPFVELGEHVIMPNHVHGIIIINKPVEKCMAERDGMRRDGMRRDVETQNFASLHPGAHPGTHPGADSGAGPGADSGAGPGAGPGADSGAHSGAWPGTHSGTWPGPAKNKFGPQSQNLASIVRGFKIGVTKNARQINTGFAWQSRYYDHIIRNENEYRRIAQYILDNPAKWADDRFNVKVTV